MQDGLPTTVNGGVVSDRAAIAEQHNVTCLCRTFDLPESCGRHIIQIEILPMSPPIILTRKIRHSDSSQMIGILEQGVTVHHAMFKLPAQQRRNAAESLD